MGLIFRILVLCVVCANDVSVLGRLFRTLAVGKGGFLEQIEIEIRGARRVLFLQSPSSRGDLQSVGGRE